MTASGLPSAMLPAPGTAELTNAELQACLRNLISLIALPAMTAGSDPREILKRFCEALSALLPIDLCVATGPLFVHGGTAPRVIWCDDVRIDDGDERWTPLVARCAAVQGSTPELSLEDTPCGPMRVVKLAMSYGSESGSLAAGARRPDFPTLGESAVLRAAASLAAGQLQTARLMQEREEASRVKDEFLAMLGHELRNPLAPIVTALALMKRRGDTGTATEQAIIRRQVDHLVRLVDDLLDVAKLARSKIDLRRETIEMASSLMSAVEMARPLLERHRHRLTIDVPATGLLWHGDPTRLSQVVSNLLTNAARYTEKSGDISLTARREDDMIEISVKDNGRGISAEMLPHVFDLFFQGKRTIDRAEGGLGLGLALVKNLVQLHSGEVFAKSTGVGQGSEFTVRLPAAPPGVDATPLGMGAAPDFRPEPTTEFRRVLIVDDNVDGADAMGGILRDHGHQVRVVYDPITALEATLEFRPDVAILDIGLPGMDGYQLAQRIGSLVLDPVPQLIALTGYGRDHDKLRSAHAGFTKHLVKPVATQQLLDLVERICQV